MKRLWIVVAFAIAGLASAGDACSEPFEWAKPILVEDFSTYLNTTDFLANPRGIWRRSEGAHVAQISLDTTVGYGTSSRSMRYDFPNNGNVCLDYAIRPGYLNIPPGRTHVWIEYVVRFGKTFAVNAGAPICGAEYKLAALGDINNGSGRWNVPEMQANEWVTGYPGNEAGYILPAPTPKSLWDGNPHVFRVEAKLSPSGGTGLLRFWVDGVLLLEKTGFDTDITHHEIDIFGPGLNLNQGPSISGIQIWWHKISVYDGDPGWIR